MAELGISSPAEDGTASAVAERREAGRDAPAEGRLSASDTPLPAPAELLYFKMRGKNTLATVVTWLVFGAEDPTAAQYTGGNTPLTDISVAAAWSA